MSETDCKAGKDMTKEMEETMRRLRERFTEEFVQLESKIDEIGTRIDHFERDVAELTTQVGMEEQTMSK